MSTIRVQNVYESLGIRPLINAAGNLTVLGGSVPSEFVLEAMAAASRDYVPISELQDVVHARLGALTSNGCAYVTSGAAAGLYLATMGAASHRFGRPIEKIGREDLGRARVLIPAGCRSPYDVAVQQIGVQLVEFERVDELEERLDDRTVAVLHIPAGWNRAGTPSFDDVRAVAQRGGVPMLVDAAAQVPPKASLWRYTHAGADVAIFSGGKGLRGPQTSGLVLGHGPVMDWIQYQGYPRDGHGRVLKVGREQLVGLLAAVEEIMANDEDAHRRWCEAQVGMLLDAYVDDERVSMRRCFPNIAGQPLPYVEVQARAGNFDPSVVATSLQDATPRVVVGTIPGADSYAAGFIVNTLALRPGDMKSIVMLLRETLDQVS